MLRVHLAQIYYNPTIKRLEEPCYIPDSRANLRDLSRTDKINSSLSYFKESYIEYFRQKVIDIAEWSGENDSHLLVFPEYSIPLQVLPDLKKIASKHSMIIVAASHRVYLDNEA